MALIYSRSTLVSLSSGQQKHLLNTSLWRSLTEYGIPRTKLARRGCRAGVRKQRLLLTLEFNPSSSTILNIRNYNEILTCTSSSVEFFQYRNNLLILMAAT